MEHQSIDLSICIASYGNDVGSLIEALLGEIEANPSLSNTEILISDQCSEAHPLQQNWTQHPRVRYHHYTELRGRAANRNHLVALSQGAQLLFLDADALRFNRISSLNTSSMQPRRPSLWAGPHTTVTISNGCAIK